MKTLVIKLVTAAGYRDTNHFIDSTFYPNLMGHEVIIDMVTQE